MQLKKEYDVFNWCISLTLILIFEKGMCNNNNDARGNCRGNCGLTETQTACRTFTGDGTFICDTCRYGTSHETSHDMHVIYDDDETGDENTQTTS